MKTAIFGGAFDPIHNGHINMMESAMNEYCLDRVIVVPSGHSPNKDESNMTSFEHRFNMCQIAVRNLKSITVSDIEHMCNSTSYTYATLLKFKEMYPLDELYFIMGADSLDYFEKWYHPEIIAQTAAILVISREDMDIDVISAKIKEINTIFPADIRIVHCNKIDVSSTMIRSNIKKHQDITGILPGKVIDYIRQNELYR